MVWPCHEERGSVNDDGCNEVNFNDDERSMSINITKLGSTTLAMRLLACESVKKRSHGGQ